MGSLATVSPKRVDGWLGIMIGDALWYPAWDPSQLQETANRIAVKIKSTQHGDVSINHGKSVGLLMTEPEDQREQEPQTSAPEASHPSVASSENATAQIA